MTTLTQVKNYIKRKREVFFIGALEEDLKMHVQEITDGNTFMYWDRDDPLPTDRRLLIEVIVRELQRREKEKNEAQRDQEVLARQAEEPNACATPRTGSQRQARSE